MGVLRVGQADTPPLGPSDPDILRWCESNAVSLVTNNRRSMPGHLREHLAAGQHVPGIFILDDSRPDGIAAASVIMTSACGKAERDAGITGPRHEPEGRR